MGKIKFHLSPSLDFIRFIKMSRFVQNNVKYGNLSMNGAAFSLPFSDREEPVLLLVIVHVYSSSSAVHAVSSVVSATLSSSSVLTSSSPATTLDAGEAVLKECDFSSNSSLPGPPVPGTLVSVLWSTARRYTPQLGLYPPPLLLDSGQFEFCTPNPFHCTMG